MRILKVISLLLGYPQAETLAHLDEVAEAIRAEARLPEALRERLLELVEHLRAGDLIDLQQTYVGLFDRGRQLSLHLFEHVHGESRDRGQAMVDLMTLYRRHGFALGVRELPDYIPLFLEYCAHRPEAEARELLGDAMPILALIGARLAERGSRYHVLFEALAALVGDETAVTAARAQAVDEGPDETVVNMDKLWEEEQVRFLGSPAACQAQAAGQAAPVRWVRR